MKKIETVIASLYNKINDMKQDKLIAGNWISIEDNTISINYANQPVEYCEVVDGAIQVVVMDGSTARISVKIFGDDLTYQWYYSTTGKSWANTSMIGNKTSTLKLTGDSIRNNYLYKCVVKSGNKKWTSPVYRLIVVLEESNDTSE